MSICGGQHRSKAWTKDEIRQHMKEPCVDCYCGISFKKSRTTKEKESQS